VPLRTAMSICWRAPIRRSQRLSSWKSTSRGTTSIHPSCRRRRRLGSRKRDRGHQR